MVLLSGSKPEAVEPLIRQELDAAPAGDPWKASSVQEIQDLLERVRVKRVVSGKGHIFPGYSGICSPIYDHEGSVCAALMAMGAVPQFDRSEDGANADTLKRVAAGVSERIGWREKDPN
jgi:DNA-binding IclR family transcriptional regulator